MESRCVAKYIHVTPRKMRLVADLVRGKSVNDAIGLLKFTPKSGARPILKAIQSAAANVVNRDDSKKVNPDHLVVKTIFVDEGPSFKRFLPRAMGRATPIRKRMSHVTVLVGIPAEAGENLEEAAPVVEEVKEAKTESKRKPAAAKTSSKTDTKKRPAKKKSE